MPQCSCEDGLCLPESCTCIISNFQDELGLQGVGGNVKLCIVESKTRNILNIVEGLFNSVCSSRFWAILLFLRLLWGTQLSSLIQNFYPFLHSWSRHNPSATVHWRLFELGPGQAHPRVCTWTMQLYSGLLQQHADPIISRAGHCRDLYEVQGILRRPSSARHWGWNLHHGVGGGGAILYIVDHQISTFWKETWGKSKTIQRTKASAIISIVIIHVFVFLTELFTTNNLSKQFWILFVTSVGIPGSCYPMRLPTSEAISTTVTGWAICSTVTLMPTSYRGGGGSKLRYISYRMCVWGVVIRFCEIVVLYHNMA